MIAIVDYKAGNLTSVLLAFQALGVDAEITSDADFIRSADRVVFPGVGAAGAAMMHLNEVGLASVLTDVVDAGTPFLGICVGTQILFDSSEEDGGVQCLGLVPGEVKRFRPSDPMCKIPQIGWNTVEFKTDHPLFAEIEKESEFYFVHSYYPAPTDQSYVLAETEYADVRFSCVVGRGNMAATQFHPERSGRIGLQLLRNFTSWDGSV
jgi:glutamine amidotransferase